MAKRIITYFLCIMMTELSGFAAGMLTREGTKIYADTINKPPLSPPGIVFPIAWTILYALMGIGLARVLLAEDEQVSSIKTLAVVFFFVQFGLNLAWCFIFFGAQNFVFALVELFAMLICTVVMTVLFRRIDPVAAVLQIPYICWLCFAAYLNAGVVLLN